MRSGLFSLPCVAAMIKPPIPLDPGPAHLGAGTTVPASVSIMLSPPPLPAVITPAPGTTTTPPTVRPVASSNILISTSDLVETIIGVTTVVINHPKASAEGNSDGVPQTRVITTTFISHSVSSSIPVIETITHVIPPVPANQSGPMTILSSFTTLTTIPVPVTLQESHSDGSVAPTKILPSQTDGDNNSSSGDLSSSSRNRTLRKIILISTLCGSALIALSGFAVLTCRMRMRITGMPARRRGRDKEDKALTGS
jgi:hypothetical protein